jgi:hypothetical protein
MTGASASAGGGLRSVASLQISVTPPFGDSGLPQTLLRCERGNADEGSENVSAATSQSDVGEPGGRRREAARGRSFRRWRRFTG